MVAQSGTKILTPIRAAQSNEISSDAGTSKSLFHVRYEVTHLGELLLDAVNETLTFIGFLISCGEEQRRGGVGCVACY